MSYELSKEPISKVADALDVIAADMFDRGRGVDAAVCQAGASALRALEPSPEREGKPQVVGRVWKSGSTIKSQLNSIGRELPDDAPLYAHPPAPRATEQAWIPVSEKLPERNRNVLALHVRGYPDLVEWRDEYAVIAFTHWMPLPPSPKEKE